MGSGANNGNNKKLDTRVSPQLAQFVEGLAKLGIYGSSTAEVVRYFVTEGVRRARVDREIENALKDEKLLSGQS